MNPPVPELNTGVAEQFLRLRPQLKVPKNKNKFIALFDGHPIFDDRGKPLVMTKNRFRNKIINLLYDRYHREYLAKHPYRAQAYGGEYEQYSQWLNARTNSWYAADRLYKELLEQGRIKLTEYIDPL